MSDGRNTANSGESPLFAYPASAAFKRVLPKNRIYAYARASRRLQKRFADEVAQIVWAYKLAPETIRLDARPDVPEIQVFAVKLKEATAQGVSEDILRCIDRAIGFPIIFELLAGDRVQTVAAYKRPSEADSAKWVVGDYFASPWLPADAERSLLPVALDLGPLSAAAQPCHAASGPRRRVAQGPCRAAGTDTAARTRTPEAGDQAR